MAYHLSNRSKSRLKEAHPDLRAVVMRAIEISEIDFTVMEVARTIEKQRQYVKNGVSMTMNSRHLPKYTKKCLTGDVPDRKVSFAVDLGAWIEGKVSWAWPPYHKIAKAMKQAAKELNIPIEWGGDWKKFKDGPHFQLPHRNYPGA